MAVPANYEIWLPKFVRKMIGLNDDDWLSTGEYIGDHSIEFSPQRIKIHLRQLNTSRNLKNEGQTLSGSQLL